MKVVVRRTPRFKKAFETFLKADASRAQFFFDLPQIFQEEAAWGEHLGKGLYKSEMIMENITCYTPKKKDTVVTIWFAVECKVRKTEKGTTVTLQTIYATGAPNDAYT